MKTFKLILKNVVFSLSSLLLCALALVVLLGFLAYDGGGSFYETFGSNFASYLVLAVALALYCALSFFGIEKWRIHGCAYSASLFIGFILCIPIARITFENLFSGLYLIRDGKGPVRGEITGSSFAAENAAAIAQCAVTIRTGHAAVQRYFIYFLSKLLF